MIFRRSGAKPPLESPRFLDAAVAVRCVVTPHMRVFFVEQVTAFPSIPEGRVAVVDVAFAAGAGYESATLPFIASLGDRLALWIDHHEHPIGWSRFREDPRFLLVPRSRERTPARSWSPSRR